VRPGDGDPEAPKVVDRAVLAERRARRAELGEQMHARRAAEAESVVADLTAQLAALEVKLERAASSPARAQERLEESRRALRAAEQREHAERQRRHEESEEAGLRLREARAEAARARERLAEAQRAVRDLTAESEGLRRRVAEAEQTAAAAAAARRRAESEAQSARVLSEEPPAWPAAPPGPGGVLEREGALARRAPRAAAAATPGGAMHDPVGLDAERRLLAARAAEQRGERLLAAARELVDDVAGRLEGEGALRGELEAERAGRRAAEAELERQRLLTARVRGALDTLRDELARMRRAAPALDLEALGARAEELAPRAAETSAPTADRLEAARERLRAADQPEEAAPSTAARSAAAWLPRAFASLAREDPALAGRCVVELLPALGAVVDSPVRFVLRVGETRAAVEAAPGRCSVTGAPPPDFRPSFRLRASEQGLGRFVAAPTAGRWPLAPGRALIRGRRSDAGVLRGLVRAPLGFAELAAAGVLLEPEMAYALLARAIVPGWTAGHSFAVLHETTGPVGARAFVSVRDGGPVTVTTEEPGERVAATVSCSPPALLPLLAGAPLPAGERAAIRGEADALRVLQDWIARAQAGPLL
jgi:hypothetical protein